MTTATTTTTDELVHQLLIAERAIDRAEERADALKAELIERLGVDGRHETDEAKVAVVETHTPVLDVEALQAATSKHTFYKLTKRVVDMAKVKALRGLDALPEEVVEIIGERVSKPSVRLTIKNTGR